MSMGVYISLDGNVTERENDKYSFFSPDLLRELIWTNAIPEGLDIGFDFKIFDKVKSYLHAKPIETEQEIWNPDEVIKIFKALEAAVKKNNSRLPVLYSIFFLKSATKQDYQGWGRSATIFIDSSEWYFSCDWNEVIATQKNGKKIDLLKEQSSFKIGVPFKGKANLSGGSVPGSELFFKIDKVSTVYDYFKLQFRQIFNICEYAKKKGKKIHMSIG